MRKAAMVLLALVATLVGACGEATTSTDLWGQAVVRQARERGVLRVAMEPEFRPFEYIDESGTLVGFDVDMARMIGQELGVRVEFVRVKWDAIIPTLINGEADFIISGMTATPERALTVAYSDPYFHTITALLVAKSLEGQVKGIQDLNDPSRTIAVKLGTTGAVAAKKRCPKAKIVELPTENAAAMEVAQGRADAMLYDLKSVENHHARHPDTTFLIRTPVSVEPYAIALRRGDTESVSWLNLVLHHLREDGRLRELHEKYDLPILER